MDERFIIQRATVEDCGCVSILVVQSFRPEVDRIVEERAVLADAIGPALDLGRFTVAARKEGPIVGIVGLSDARGRALDVKVEPFMDAMGAVEGLIAAQHFHEWCSRSLGIGPGARTVEYLSVSMAFRRLGIGSGLLSWVAVQPGVRKLLATVPAASPDALGCFGSVGFRPTGCLNLSPGPPLPRDGAGLINLQFLVPSET